MTIHYHQITDKYPRLFKELVNHIKEKISQDVSPFLFEVYVKKALCDEEYEAIDKELLDLFHKGLLHSLFLFWKTNYYKTQRVKRKKSFGKTFKYLKKYYLVFRSFKKRGYTPRGGNKNDFPWIFICKEFTMRLDGHHRLGVAKSLNVKKLPMLVFNHYDLLDCSVELKECLEKLTASQKDFKKWTYSK